MEIPKTFRSENIMIDIKELTRFLVKAKVNTYAINGKEIPSQRPGFKELEFIEGNWEYRDSYTGFYFAPGQEIVRFKGKPVWAMSYNGGINEKYHSNLDFAKQTYKFLKEALKRVEESRPFRGPKNFKQEGYEYVDKSEGDIRFFRGTEKIFYKGKEVFIQDYLGGLILHKQ